MDCSRILNFLNTNQLASPCLLIDLQVIEAQYKRIMGTFSPSTLCYFSIKTCPVPNIIKRLLGLGARWDAASIHEINLCLEAGADPAHILFGNTVKKDKDIANAYAKGVRSYVFDSTMELEKLAANAPGAFVICRIKTQNNGAVHPLVTKGCAKHSAIKLLLRAKELGLVPTGVSFHVGSQQMFPEAWEQPIKDAAEVYQALYQQGITLQVLDIGGGFPEEYSAPVLPIESYGEVIKKALTTHFSSLPPHQLYIEPGRFLVASAGTIKTEVLLISDLDENTGKRWVYLDAGAYTGMGMEETIKSYPIITERKSATRQPVMLAGPTCDSTDIIFKDAQHFMPSNLALGDKVIFLKAGAYTLPSYGDSLGFNGFDSLHVYCME